MHHVWSASSKTPEDDCCSVTCPVGGRCPCEDRLTLLIQCQHECRVERMFNHEKYSNRYFNEDFYCKNCYDYQRTDRFSDDNYQCTNNSVSELIEDGSKGDTNWDDDLTQNSLFENPFAQNSVFENPLTQNSLEENPFHLCKTMERENCPKLSHNMLLTKFTDLCGMLQNDQEEMRMWHCVTSKPISHCREQIRVDVTVKTIGSSRLLPRGPSRDPLVALTKPVPNSTNVSRKRSQLENIRRGTVGF